MMDIVSEVMATGSTTVLSLADAKEYLRVTSTGEHTTIKRQLRTATLFCERRIPGGRTLLKRTYQGKLADFPASNGRLELPRPPLFSSTGLSITYRNSTNGSAALSSTVYDLVVPVDEPAFLEPKQNEDWPSVYDRPDAVTVQWEGGYGAAGDVPEVYKDAVLLKLEQLWDPARVPAADVHAMIDYLLDTYDYGHYG